MQHFIHVYFVQKVYQLAFLLIEMIDIHQKVMKQQEEQVMSMINLFFVQNKHHNQFLLKILQKKQRV
jgi:hypothetical protein